MLKNEGKKFFLIATADANKKKQLTDWVNMKFADAVVYTASDYMECLVKCKNAPPNILITDHELPKAKPAQMIEQVLADKESHVAMIVMNSVHPSDAQQDAVVIGRMQVLPLDITQDHFYNAIQLISNYAFHQEASQYSLKFLKAGDLLMREGDSSQQVYIVKKGQLKAYKGPAGSPELGLINVGEFVGEMAYFNGEARMANVEAVTECELIEIQPKTFEQVIYQRPSWVKTLVSTLSKRLKKQKTVT